MCFYQVTYATSDFGDLNAANSGFVHSVLNSIALNSTYTDSVCADFVDPVSDSSGHVYTLSKISVSDTYADSADIIDSMGYDNALVQSFS